MIKWSSGEYSSSGIIHNGQCLYYGFVCVTGGSDRTVKLYDSIDDSGNVVESFVADGNKPTDGHSHSNPVDCANGLYLSISGGSVVVYYLPRGLAGLGRNKMHA